MSHQLYHSQDLSPSTVNSKATRLPGGLRGGSRSSADKMQICFTGVQRYGGFHVVLQGYIGPYA